MDELVSSCFRRCTWSGIAHKCPDVVWRVSEVGAMVTVGAGGAGCVYNDPMMAGLVGEKGVQRFSHFQFAATPCPKEHGGAKPEIKTGQVGDLDAVQRQERPRRASTTCLNAVCASTGLTIML